MGAALERVVEFARLLHDAGRIELERPGRGRVLLFPGCRGLGAGLARAVPMPKFVQTAPLMAFVLWSVWALATGALLVRGALPHPQVSADR